MDNTYTHLKQIVSDKKFFNGHISFALSYFLMNNFDFWGYNFIDSLV